MYCFDVVLNNGKIVKIEATSVRGAWGYTESDYYVVAVEIPKDCGHIDCAKWGD